MICIFLINIRNEGLSSGKSFHIGFSRKYIGIVLQKANEAEIN
jgi:hypothetical protein